MKIKYILFSQIFQKYVVGQWSYIQDDNTAITTKSQVKSHKWVARKDDNINKSIS